MGKKQNLVGRVFGRLTVLQETKRRSSSGSIILKCRCSCPKQSLVKTNTSSLNSGNTKSCGCLKIEAAKTGNSRRKHGAAKSKYKKGSSQLDYVIWVRIVSRCHLKTDERYKDYGKRGISIYKEWRKDFALFAAYIRTLENCPSEEILISRLFGKRLPRSIDRINNDGNYEPGNIKWSTSIEQNNNRRDNRIVEYQGNKMTLAQAVRSFAVVSYATVLARLDRHNWSLEKALLTPVRKT